MPNQASYVGPVFADNTDEFRLQQRQLAERKRLAQELVSQGMTDSTGSGYHSGKVFIVGNPWGNVAKSIGGALMGAMADRDERNLAQQQGQAQQEWQQQFDAADTPEAKQALMIDARNRGLRYDLEKSFFDADAARIERGEQLAADRVAKAEEAELNRIERGEQQAADRVAREDLRRIPSQSVHVSVSGGGGGAANPFAGAATQAGIDPRDDMPVYRVSKTGELFKYGENGPVAHAGAVAPKPAAAKEPTESERSSAGYLGRMEAAEKHLTDAQPLPLWQQKGLDKAPSLTNYTLTPKQQVTRQQQEDWVRAKLRKESGAVIGEEEMAREIRTYFPQAGDSPQVIQQKAQSRAQAHEQMRSSAGRSKPTEAAPVQSGKPAVGTVKNGYRFKGGDPANESNWEVAK